MLIECDERGCYWIMHKRTDINLKPEAEGKVGTQIVQACPLVYL